MVSIERIIQEEKRIASLEREMQRQKAIELKNNPFLFEKELEKEVKHERQYISNICNDYFYRQRIHFWLFTPQSG